MSSYSSYRYFLYAWCSRWNCYWPVELYASKAYAKKVAAQKGYTDFYIKRIVPYLRFDDDCVKFYLDDCKHVEHVKGYKAG